MNKICLISLIILSLLSLLIQCKRNYIEDYIDDYDIKFEENIKKFLKKYLIKNNLFQSDRTIERKEMKKIFIDVMLEGAPIDEVDEYTKELYEELARIFLDIYYNQRIEIKGMDIYELMDIKAISKKLYELNGEIPIYDFDNDDDVIDDDDDEKVVEKDFEDL